MLSKDRVLSARGLDTLLHDLEKTQVELAEAADDATQDAVVRRYGRLEDRFAALGGYAAESEAARICANLGLPDRVLDQPLGTLSGGQRRRVELARILFSGAPTLLLDEPTNHLDADSIAWLRDFLRAHDGGVVVISHDVDLLDRVVNKVWHLDANRAEADVYNVGWKNYLEAARAGRAPAQAGAGQRREEGRRAAGPGRQDAGQGDQGDRGPADGPAGRAAARRHRGRAGAGQGRPGEVPDPGAVRADPADRGRAVQVVRVARGVHRRRRWPSTAAPGSSCSASTAPARPPCCGCWPGRSSRTPARSCRGTACGSATTRRSTSSSTSSGRVLEVMRSAAPASTDGELRRVLGAFLFSGESVDQLVGTLSGGEKTRLALAALVTSGANVLLLDEPTNNLDPASREQVLTALNTYTGAVVLVTHDEGAVAALRPEKVILLPDGDEDAWSDDLVDLVALA